MKLYKIPNAPAGHRWMSHKTGLRDFETVETPKEGRQGMADFLNQNELEVAIKDSEGEPGCPDELEQAELRAIEAARPAPPTGNKQADGIFASWDAAEIEDFVLNRASVAQVEHIFATLGTRFKELAKTAGE